MPTEKEACSPIIPDAAGLNTKAKIPFGCKPAHILAAMHEWIDFLGFINGALHPKGLARFECMLMPANFSSMVGEFMGATLPKHCKTVVKNRYHNGHPDLLPVGAHVSNAIQHHHEGIEIKASRYVKGWQGHNPEDTWLMVFVFDSNRPTDSDEPKPFKFVGVFGAQLVKADWNFSGRSDTSRRTITASVNPSGYKKMLANWIYQHPNDPLDG